MFQKPKKQKIDLGGILFSSESPTQKRTAGVSPAAAQKVVRQSYLPLPPFLMVSTTCVEGFPCAVLTVVNRPELAFRPIFDVLDMQITSFPGR